VLLVRKILQGKVEIKLGKYEKTSERDFIEKGV
jgi:hypothetical protein